jgi:signal transduction histidine kinase/Na+/proline symporter
MISLGTLALGVVAYLALLFLIAHATERGLIPARWVRHPIAYTLSLGVYATAWTYYGGVGLAAQQGYLYLTTYLGATLSFLLAPVLLRPLLRLVRNYQLTSLADLFAFRFPSPLTGMLVTVLMLMGLLPYIALQVDAVVGSVRLLNADAAPQPLAAGFCATIALFAVLFGARQITPREKHEGLVAAIAFESAIKLVAILAAGAFALFGVFHGPVGLQQWTVAHPEAVAALYRPLAGNSWTTLLLLAFSAAFLLPRQFQMLFTENIEPRTLMVASWGFPLLLLLLNVAVPLVLWAARVLKIDTAPDYYLLALARHEPSGWLTLLVFIGGVSAASAMIVVESLALAAMALNHLVLPVMLRLRSAPKGELYSALLWSRRALIVLIVFTGYLAYLLLERTRGLASLGLVSFVAVAQFLPATVSLFAWPRATRLGFLLGVSGGMVVWVLTLVLPLLGVPAPAQWFPGVGLDVWGHATFWSLGVNGVLFAVGSLATTPTPKEIAADQACRLNAVLTPSQLTRPRSVMELEQRIASRLGTDTARNEVARALRELNIQHDEDRTWSLLFLTERVERNLSGLLGPEPARVVLASADASDDAALPMEALVEAQLEHSQGDLQGLAAELDALRRLHRQVLLDLPVGACSLGAQGEVLLWNSRMSIITGVADEHAFGRRATDLPSPWNELLSEFVASGRAHAYKLRVEIGDHTRWLNLHHERLSSMAGGVDAILLVEDLTDQQRLEAERAHRERLASIGLFAAGVAHEIGNPLTGISSLTQNLREESDPAQWRESLDEILTQTRRINDIVRTLLNFAHAGSTELSLCKVDVNACVAEAIRLVKLSPSGRRMEFDVSSLQAPEVFADSARLLQILVNLLSNAADASPPEGRIEIASDSIELDGMPAFELSVRDYGSGIAPELQPHIFEPFFTTKDPGQGTGLGLPLVYTMVREHGGCVHVASLVGDGTTVTVHLLQPASNAGSANRIDREHAA